MRYKNILTHPLLYVTIFAFILRILYFRTNETFTSSDEVYLFQNSLKPLTFILNYSIQDYAAQLFRYFNFNWGWVTLSFSTINTFILHILNIPLTEVTINLPYIILGTLTMPVIYLLGKELHNKRTGLIATLIFAIQPVHVSTSRSIGLVGIVVTFFFCLTLLLFLKYFKTQKLKKTAFFTLGLYFATDHQFYLILPLLLLLGTLNKKEKSLYKKVLAVIKDFFSKEIIFFLIPTIPIFASAAHLYSKNFLHNAYIMHIFQKSSYWGFFIDTTFKEFYYMFGPPLFTLFIISVIYAVFKIIISQEYKTTFFLLIWLSFSLIPWFFIVSRQNTVVVAYLIHSTTALIFLSSLFINDMYNKSKKIIPLAFSLIIFLTLIITISITYQSETTPLYQLIDTPIEKAYTHFGAKGTNTGIKTAGYYLRENSPKNTTVYSDHELFVTQYYTGRISLGTLDLFTEENIIKNYETQNTTIDYVYTENKHKKFLERLHRDKFAPEVYIFDEKKHLGTILSKNTINIPLILQVKNNDLLFDKKYGNLHTLFVNYT